jgi:hypothetical protein
MLACVHGFAKSTKTDYEPIDITTHTPQTQVFPAEYATELGREQARLEAVNVRLDSIDQSVKDVRGDIKELMATNYVVNFVLGSLKIFVPIVFTVWIGIWMNDRYKRRRATT